MVVRGAALIINDVVLDLENSMDLEPAATPWYDLSRYKNHGAVTTATWVQEPSGLWVMAFDGANDWIDCGGNASILSATQGTYEVWVKGIGTTGLAGKGPAGTDELYLQWGVSPRIVYYRGGANIYRLDALGAGVNTAIWNYVVLTSDGITIRLYINGEVEILITTVGVNNGDWFGDNGNFDLFSIGSVRRVAPLYFTGDIGGVRLCNYALSAGNIAARFQAKRYLYGA